MMPDIEKNLTFSKEQNRGLLIDGLSLVSQLDILPVTQSLLVPINHGDRRKARLKVLKQHPSTIYYADYGQDILSAILTIPLFDLLLLKPLE